MGRFRPLFMLIYKMNKCIETQAHTHVYKILKFGTLDVFYCVFI